MFNTKTLTVGAIGLLMVFGMAGCREGKISEKKLSMVADIIGAETYDDLDEFIDSYEDYWSGDQFPEGICISTDDEKYIRNLSKGLYEGEEVDPELIESATVFQSHCYDQEKYETDILIVYAFTFVSERDAREWFEQLDRSFEKCASGDGVKTTQDLNRAVYEYGEDGCRYSLLYLPPDPMLEDISLASSYGAYISGRCVMFAYDKSIATAHAEKLQTNLEKICYEMGIKAPWEAEGGR